jgi:hypothetical protein
MKSVAKSLAENMDVTELQRLIRQQPFRPFTIRLNNGFSYVFEKPERFGAPDNLSTIFHFGPETWSIIAPESISEIRDLANNPGSQKKD